MNNSNYRISETLFDDADYDINTAFRLNGSINLFFAFGMGVVSSSNAVECCKDMLVSWIISHYTAKLYDDCTRNSIQLSNKLWHNGMRSDNSGESERFGASLAVPKVSISIRYCRIPVRKSADATQENGVPIRENGVQNASNNNANGNANGEIMNPNEAQDEVAVNNRDAGNNNGNGGDVAIQTNDAFRDNIRVFLQECAVIDEYKIDGNLTGDIFALIVSPTFKSAFPAPAYVVDAARSMVPQAGYVWRIILMFGAVPALMTYYWHMKMPETRTVVHATGGLNATEYLSNYNQNQHEIPNVGSSLLSSSASEKQFSDCSAAEKSHVSDSATVVKSSSSQGVQNATVKLENMKFPNGQHVIIPQHIQVPDAVKNVLSFGRLDASFGVNKEINSVNNKSNENFNPVADSTHEEIVNFVSCDQDEVSASQANHTDHPQSPSHLPGKNSPVDTDIPSSGLALKDDQPKQDTLPAAGPPFPVDQTAPSYNFGFMPPMLADMLVQPEVFDSQAHISNSMAGNSLAMSTSASTPPTQTAAAGQSSVAVSPQPIFVFRQPYPPANIVVNEESAADNAGITFDKPVLQRMKITSYGIMRFCSS